MDAACQASLSFAISQSLLKLMAIKSVMPSNHLILCHPLLRLPSVFPSIRVFSVSQLFTLGGQGIGNSPSASVLPMSIEGWFPLGLAGLISLLSKTLSRVFASTTVWKHQLFSTQSSLWEETLTSVHDYGKTIALTIETFVGKVMPLLFNTLSRFVKDFLPRSKCLLISWLQSPSTVILEPKKIKSVTATIFFPLFTMKWWDRMPWS